MKAFERVEIKHHTLFTSTLCAGGGQVHPPVTPSLDKESRYTNKRFAHSQCGRDRVLPIADIQATVDVLT